MHRSRKHSRYHTATILSLSCIADAEKPALPAARDGLTGSTPGASPQETEESVSRGVEYLEQAARAGDRWSMITLAKALDTGAGLGGQRERNWVEACLWYGLALSRTERDDEGEYDGCMDDPDYLLLARQAELTLQGGHGLDRDPQAAGECSPPHPYTYVAMFSAWSASSSASCVAVAVTSERPALTS